MSKKFVSSILIFKIVTLLLLISTWIICIFSQPPIEIGKAFWSTFMYCMTQFFMELIGIRVEGKSFQAKIGNLSKGMFSIIIVSVVCIAIILKVNVPNSENVLWGVLGVAMGFLFGTEGQNTPEG